MVGQASEPHANLCLEILEIPKDPFVTETAMQVGSTLDRDLEGIASTAPENVEQFILDRHDNFETEEKSAAAQLLNAEQALKTAQENYDRLKKELQECKARDVAYQEAWRKDIIEIED